MCTEGSEKQKYNDKKALTFLLSMVRARRVKTLQETVR